MKKLIIALSISFFLTASSLASESKTTNSSKLELLLPEVFNAVLNNNATSVKVLVNYSNKRGNKFVLQKLEKEIKETINYCENEIPPLDDDMCKKQALRPLAEEYYEIKNEPIPSDRLSLTNKQKWLLVKILEEDITNNHFAIELKNLKQRCGSTFVGECATLFGDINQKIFLLSQLADYLNMKPENTSEKKDAENGIRLFAKKLNILKN